MGSKGFRGKEEGALNVWPSHLASRDELLEPQRQAQKPAPLVVTRAKARSRVPSPDESKLREDTPRWLATSSPQYTFWGI